MDCKHLWAPVDGGALEPPPVEIRAECIRCEVRAWITLGTVEIDEDEE